MSDRNARYIESGYSPDDGLGYGHWEQGPNGIQRWVGELESAKSRVVRVGECSDCQATIDHRATRCRSCSTRRQRRKDEAA